MTDDTEQGPAEALLSKARSAFHAGLLEGILTVDENGIPSNADKGHCGVMRPDCLAQPCAALPSTGVGPTRAGAVVVLLRAA